MTWILIFNIQQQQEYSAFSTLHFSVLGVSESFQLVSQVGAYLESMALLSTFCTVVDKKQSPVVQFVGIIIIDQ